MHFNTTHGMSTSREYICWRAMIARCTKPSHPKFEDYGARGITVSQEWLASVEKFVADMGRAPVGMSLERVKNDLGYSKANCVWATRAAQTLNRRSTVWIEVGDDRLCLKAACAKYGVAEDTVRYRYRAHKIDHQITFNQLRKIST